MIVIQTEKLNLTGIKLSDAEFMLELVNSEGWLKFIGDRNVHTLNEAENYIAKIIEKENTNYWVVRLESARQPMGVVTLMKRDYLTYFDIGFAFLPEFKKRGYAFEATSKALILVLDLIPDKTVCAISDVQNLKSNCLLQKLDFKIDYYFTLNEDNLICFSKKL